MANADTPHGLNATGVQYGLNGFSVDNTGGSTAVFKGDLLCMLATGLVAPLGATHNIGAAESVVSPSTAAKSLVAAATSATVLAHYHMDQKYIIQDDGAAVGVQSTIGTNANLVAGAGSTVTGISAHEIDASNFATANTTTAALVFRINNLFDHPDNSFGANADWVVTINEHFLTAGSAGI
jgi:hypothetical protein|tara:strand:+ start:696 stop:1238 length:543 start_codon:yes stop_codon:yes gene_type:complete